MKVIHMRQLLSVVTYFNIYDRGFLVFHLAQMGGESNHPPDYTFTIWCSDIPVMNYVQFCILSIPRTVTQIHVNEFVLERVAEEQKKNLYRKIYTLEKVQTKQTKKVK